MNNFEIVNGSILSSENLVVFVHGFTGTYDTWKMQNNKMPFIDQVMKETILKEYYTIALFRYESEQYNNEKPTSVLTRLFSEKKRENTGFQQHFNQTIPNIAKVFDTSLRTYMKRKKIEHLNLSLVTHSMGGLVCKQFILDNLKKPEIKIETYHSIFVPHNGSELAAARNILSIIPFYSNVQAIDLEPNSIFLSELTRGWLKAIHEKLPLPKTYYYRGFSDSTVKDTSAEGFDMRTENVYSVPLNFGHSEFLELKCSDDILVWVKDDLEKQIKIGSIEEVRNEIKQEFDNTNDEINLLDQELERVFPNCKELNCLLYNKQNLMDATSAHILKYIDNKSDSNLKGLKGEIDYIIEGIRSFLLYPDQEIKEVLGSLKRFEKQPEIYEEIINFIGEHTLGNCSCEIKNTFSDLKYKFQAELEMV